MPERSLDPTDWSSFRRLAHATLDQAIDFVATAADRPVWQPIPSHIKAEFAPAEPPRAPSPADELVDTIARTVLPYSCGNTHPRFFGWVHGTGTAGGILAEMLAAAVNANLGGREHAAVHVEKQVIDWCRRIFDFPQTAGGLLVSGTSMATLIALTAARNHAASLLTSGESADIRKSGLQSLPRRLVAYTSAEAHGSVVKALELIGVGRDWVRAVPVDAALQMDVASLQVMIESDRHSGHQPFAVIATAGTVNTGAIDPLNAIADLCASEQLWLHVDGAFGALAVLSETLKPRLTGIERADSIAFDFHKWLHVPYDAGCVLIRHGDLQLAAFSQRPAYLASAERGLAAGEPWFCEMGPELSRGFRALKVWFTLKEHGLDRLAEKISDNCAQARYLAAQIAELEDFELAAPVPLNIVCFRVTHPQLGAAEQDRLNADIVVELQERGIAAPSTTRLDGRIAIRVNITNHRTTMADIDVLVDAVRELAMDRLMMLAARRSDLQVNHVTAREQSRPSLEIDDDRRFRRLQVLLASPDIAPLADGVDVVMNTALAQPFRVSGGVQVEISGAALDAPDGAVVLVRHALELAAWHGPMADRIAEPSWAAAASLLSARCAATYLSSLAVRTREAAIAALPDRLRHIYARLSGARDWSDVRELLLPGGTSLAAELLPLLADGEQHIRAVQAAASVKAEAADLTLRFAELAVPAEILLTQGGDSRVELQAETGCNAYGTATRPKTGEISFSSSTASSISPAAYTAVERLRRRLMTAACNGRLDPEFRRAMSSIRREVARVTGAAKVEGSAVILTASGTDTELLALDFARAGNTTSGRRRPLVSILIDPNETGSGVPLAAAGNHYLSLTSRGVTVTPGSAIDGLGGAAVSVKTVPLRTSEGALRNLADIDREIEQLASEAIASGATCLLHVLDASKTGMGAPSIPLAVRLKECFPARIDVVVDACQMRLGTEAMRAYIEHGFMLQVTASKFYTAPPFAGALIVPPDMARRRKAQLPKGLAAYIGAAEWPATFERRLRLPASRPNLGLLSRWTAGIHEIRAFEAVPASESRAILDRFRRDVTAMMARRPDMRPLPPATFDRWDLTEADTFADLATILPFEILRRTPSGKFERLGFDELRQVYRLLTEDISARLPKGGACNDPETAATPCHLGQPVKTGTIGGRTTGVLRLCASARHVSQVYGDGSGQRTRYRVLLAQVARTLDKASLVTVNLHALT